MEARAEAFGLEIQIMGLRDRLHFLGGGGQMSRSFGLAMPVLGGTALGAMTAREREMLCLRAEQRVELRDGAAADDGEAAGHMRGQRIQPVGEGSTDMHRLGIVGQLNQRAVEIQEQAVGRGQAGRGRGKVGRHGRKHSGCGHAK